MSKELSKNIKELNDSVKNYVKTKIDLAKLSVLEKATMLTSYLLSFLIVILFFTVIVTLLTAAFVIWYGMHYNNYFDGLLIGSGSLFLLAIVFVLFRKRIITTTVLKSFSEILFREDKEEV